MVMWGGIETFKICRGSGIFYSTLVQKYICKAKVLFSDLQVKIVCFSMHSMHFSYLGFTVNKNVSVSNMLLYIIFSTDMAV